MRLEGKRVIVTGASRGIGRALAGQLANAGARVLAAARSAADLTALQAELGAAAASLTCDLASLEGREALIAAALDPAAPADGIINNAGIQIEADYLSGGAGSGGADITRELAVNLAAPLHLSAALAPHLAARGGFIVNVTSALAVAPKRAAPVYCAAKAGLRSFTRALRYQAAAAAPDLLVSDCIMALVETDMTAGRGRGKIPPEQAARELLRGAGGRAGRDLDR